MWVGVGGVDQEPEIGVQCSRDYTATYIIRMVFLLVHAFLAFFGPPFLMIAGSVPAHSYHHAQ